jgi:hypothetical protein
MQINLLGVNAWKLLTKCQSHRVDDEIFGGRVQVKKYAISIFAALALGALSLGAVADPIGGVCGVNDAEHCYGNIYALFFTDGTTTGSDNGDGTTTYDISLAINTAGYSNGPDLTGFLYAVGFKATANGSDIIDATLLDAPGDVNDWTLHFGGIANGCQDNTNGFLCADGVSLLVPDGIYQWDFEVIVNNGTLQTDSSVKASFADASGQQHGNTSADITIQTGGCPPTVCIPQQQQVPEPATLALLGIALLGLSFSGIGRRSI